MTWDKTVHALAAGASAWNDALTREGEARADARIDAMRRERHAFGRGEAVALRRRLVDEHVAASVADGLDVLEVLTHLR
jgi:hypothetical protein